jgi:aminomethyltransferase
MKSTPFTSFHIALGAKMAEFAGYNMPISYSGINDEHHTVRNHVGVFDVSQILSTGILRLSSPTTTAGII